jgi:hypothetical protein
MTVFFKIWPQILNISSSHAAPPASSWPTFPCWTRGRRAEMCMRRRVARAAPARPVVPVGPTAGGAASRSAVQLRRGPLSARRPSWSPGRQCLSKHAAQCWSCRVADGIVHQVGLSGTACQCGSTELVKAHTPCRGRPSCCNTPERASRGCSAVM